MNTKATYIFLLCLIWVNRIYAQTNSFFQPVSKENIAAKIGEASTELPPNFDAFQLDETSLSSSLESAPWEFTPEANQGKCLIAIPVGGGATETFSVVQIAILEPALAKAFPQIRTYAGVSIQDPKKTARFSLTPRGFRAVVFQAELGAVLIKPLLALKDHYIAYTFTDAPKPNITAPTRLVELPLQAQINPDNEAQLLASSDRGGDRVKLNTYRLCVAAPGEFTQDHGGTKPLALAAVTEYTNIVSAVYEKDMAIRFQLIEATQYVMFTDPNTDPFQGTTTDEFAFQNPAIMAQLVNLNSHDIGHVYARYQGGNQGVGGPGVACGQNKDIGSSAGILNPMTGDYNDNFLAIVGQEIGHQLAGGHTWNSCSGGGGRTGDTAFEPGSGNTIMSYAGLCGLDNIVNQWDLYFHAGSIQEITFFASNIATCGVLSETENSAPLVTLPYQDNFNIPIATPFELKGTAIDPDGDALTYSWEGIDAGPETPLGQPEGNTAIFRSYPAVGVSNRIFPRLGLILSNNSDPAEQLPTYTRDMTFRLTARDNKINGGGVAWADVAFKAVESAGPFLVQSPNTAGTIWRAGEWTEVKWDVANTNGALVNCQKVNIRLSKDAGQTYPIALATNTENDGSQYVLVPNELTPIARVRVEAADNVFFDLSNANFKIQNPVQPSLTLGLSTDGGTICLPDNFVTTINTASVLGYNTPVSLELLGNLPPGATASFSASSFNPGESSTLTVNLESVTEEGPFSFAIRVISGNDSLIRPINLLLKRNDFSGFALQMPVNGAINQALSQTLRWSKGLDADNYDVQFSDSPAFSSILASASNTAQDSLKINLLLEKGKAYFWRVRPNNECGAQPWSDPFFFSTYSDNCLSFTANDLPKNISANGSTTVESKINVLQGGTISDLVVSSISGYHEYFKDLEVHLISPQGTDITLWKDRCSNFNGSFNFGLSDDSPSSFPCPPPSNSNVYKPQNALSTINGQNSTGTWTLRVKDNVAGSGGTLSGFQLQFCQSVAIQSPFLVNNNVLPVPLGGNRTITPDYLLVEDPNSPHAQLIFTVITRPKKGLINKDGFGELKPGDQFTQADIDGGLIHFFDFGINANPDGFQFMVTDGEGGFFGSPMFVVQPLVGTQNLENKAFEFLIFPNPTRNSVWVSSDKALEISAQISLFNTGGQLVSSEEWSSGQERFQLDLAHLPKGIYMVRVETEKGTGVRKLVVE